MEEIEYIYLTIKLEKIINTALDYLQENLNCNKEEFIGIIIRREVLSRIYDLKNFSFL